MRKLSLLQFFGGKKVFEGMSGLKSCSWMLDRIGIDVFGLPLFSFRKALRKGIGNEWYWERCKEVHPRLQ